jgi:hypothetical protein
MDIFIVFRHCLSRKGGELNGECERDSFLGGGRDSLGVGNQSREKILCVWI